MAEVENDGTPAFVFASVHDTNPAAYVVKNLSLFASAYKLENEFARLEHAVKDPIFRRMWRDLSAKKDERSKAFQELVGDTPIRRMGFNHPHDWVPSDDKDARDWIDRQIDLSLIELLKLRAIVQQSVRAAQGNPSHDVIHVTDFDSVAVNNDPTKLSDAPVCKVEGVEFGGEQTNYPAVYWTKRMAGYRSDYEPVLDHALIYGYDLSAINKTRAIRPELMNVVHSLGSNIPCVSLYILIGATWDAFSLVYDMSLGYRKVPKPLFEARQRIHATAVVAQHTAAANGNNVTEKAQETAQP